MPSCSFEKYHVFILSFHYRIFLPNFLIVSSRNTIFHTFFFTPIQVLLNILKPYHINLLPFELQYIYTQFYLYMFNKYDCSYKHFYPFPLPQWLNFEKSVLCAFLRYSRYMSAEFQAYMLSTSGLGCMLSVSQSVSNITVSQVQIIGT